MIHTIEYKDEVYPNFQTEGNASQFAIPFAKKVCHGKGFDVGYSKPEWCFPGAVGVDDGKIFAHCKEVETECDAQNLPLKEGDTVDYIFSSHCLEHLDRWVDVLDHWYNHLAYGGTLFLYLPHPSQKYWAPFSNRKHVHFLHPKDLKAYLKHRGYKKIFVSKRDLNHSYCVMAEK